MKYSHHLTAIFAMTALMVLNSAKSNAQGMALNATGLPADNSAMLDVSSNSQGVLVPRMTAVQRTAISSPATGLLVYQTDGTQGFYFYNGTVWASLNSSGTTTPSGVGNAVNLGVGYSLSYTVQPTDGVIWSNCTLLALTFPAANAVPPGHIIYIVNVGSVYPSTAIYSGSSSDSYYSFIPGFSPSVSSYVGGVGSFWVTAISDGNHNWFIEPIR